MNFKLVKLKNSRIYFAVILTLCLLVANFAFTQGNAVGADKDKFDGGLRLILVASEIQPDGIVLQAARQSLQKLSTQFVLDAMAPSPLVDVVVTLQSSSVVQLKNAGFRVRGHIGNIVSTSVPLNQLDGLASLSDVVYIQAKPIYKALLDASTQDSKAALVRTRNPDGSFEGYTGAGAIVAVLDDGIDWQHQDFRNPDGTTRIKFLWDQHDNSFESSGGAVGSAPTLDGLPVKRDDNTIYGTVYTEAQINAALEGTGTVNSTSPGGHGTHVAGDAAGNGRGTGNGQSAGRYIGIAPEADIIFVKYLNDQGSSAGGDDVAGFDWIDERAGELGKPYVINGSYGGHVGSHDGTRGSERAVDILVASGPGKVVAFSAGNEGSDDIHAGGTFGPNGVTINAEQQDLSVFYFAFDGTTGDITVMLGETDITGEVSTSEIYSTGVFLLDQASQARAILFQTIYVSVPLTITTQTQNRRFDGWISGPAKFTSNVERSRLVGMPGTSRGAITVGSHTTKKEWDSQAGPVSVNATIGGLSYFSSPGPTRDGRIKPDLTTGGEWIMSTLSRDHTPHGLEYIDPDGVHLVMQGTSMSSPQLAGAVALLLAQNPNLMASEVKQRLIDTAVVDSFTGSVPNNEWGYGKLDVQEALDQGVTVTVSPKQATVQVTQTKQFTATVTGATNTAVTWSVNNIQGGNATVGTISNAGLYTAPATVPTPGAVTIKVISVEDTTASDTATVTIIPEGCTPGDADGNGVVNNLDVTKAERIVAELDTIPAGACPDCNEDSVVNVLDITCIEYKALDLPLPNGAPSDFAQVVLAKLVSDIVDSDTVTVQLLLDSVTGLDTASFKLNFPPEALQLLSVSAGNLTDSTTPVMNLDNAHGKANVVFNLPGFAGVSGSGAIAEVKFQILKEGADFNLTDVILGNATGQLIALNNSEFATSLPEIPRYTQLLQNFPNPFNPETWIPYKLSEPANVTVSIYDVSGELVRVMNLGVKPRGVYSSRKDAAYWDGNNQNGEEVASGLYFYSLRAGKFFSTRRMVVVR